MDKDQIIQLRNHHLKQGRNNDRRPIYPITKAECIIGDVGGSVLKVDTLPETGEEGKIYYNTTEKKYYTYTEENSWSEIGNGGLKQYVFPYQITPCFFDARTPVGPAGLDDYIEYDQEHDLILIKDGVELTMGTNGTNDAVVDLSKYYISIQHSMNNCMGLLMGTVNNLDSLTTFSKTIDVLDLYSRDLVDHSGDSWNRGRAWEFIIYTVEVNIEFDTSMVMRPISLSLKILNKKIGSIGEYILPQINIVYTALRRQDNRLKPSDTGTKGYVTGIRHIGDVLQGYTRGFALPGTTPPNTADLTTGATHFTDYNAGIGRLQISDDNNRAGLDMSTDIPLFCSLCYRGRFVANVANMNIILPSAILPAVANPSTIAGNVYEFTIFDGLFTLTDMLINNT